MATKTTDLERRIGALEDEIKQRDRRITELKEEVEEQRSLIERLREHAEDYTNCMESWREAFGMELTDEGWTWKPFWDERNKLIDDYNGLIRDWNRSVDEFKAAIGKRRIRGRPLNASEAQVDTVHKLRKRGM